MGAACPQNCKSCVVDRSTDTVARCTECNDYYRLIDATINAVAVDGNCYCTLRLRLSLTSSCSSVITHTLCLKKNYAFLFLS